MQYPFAQTHQECCQHVVHLRCTNMHGHGELRTYNLVNHINTSIIILAPLSVQTPRCVLARTNIQEQDTIIQANVRSWTHTLRLFPLLRLRPTFPYPLPIPPAMLLRNSPLSRQIIRNQTPMIVPTLRHQSPKSLLLYLIMQLNHKLHHSAPDIRIRIRQATRTHPA